MMFDANRPTVTLIMTGALVLAMGLPAIVALRRRITIPLRNLAGSMHEIAVGDRDLPGHLPVMSEDEIGFMTGRFNAFVEKPLGVPVKVAARGTRFETAARKVSSGNGDHSASTKQRATSIRETAASMEQLAGTVHEAADRGDRLRAIDAAW